MLTTISIPHSSTLIDLSSVAHATFYYRNAEDNIHLIRRPNKPTVRGVIIETNRTTYTLEHQCYPCESLLEKAKRLDILDHWTPVIKLQLRNGHLLTFEGSKAEKLNTLWKAKIYGKNG